MVEVATRTPRYAPWLKKALSIKEKTEAFWIAESKRGAIQDAVVSPKKASNQRTEDGQAKVSSNVWDAVTNDDATAVQKIIESSKSAIFQRRGDTSAADGGGGATLIHEAAFEGSISVLLALLRHIETSHGQETLRALVNDTDTVFNLATPLICACRGAKGPATARLEVVKQLIRAGADVEIQDMHGDNIIHWCARTSNSLVLRWLLKETDAGANAVFAENAKPETPLDIAKRKLIGNRTEFCAAQTVVTLLRSVDRKCNMRLKMQVIKRHSTHLHSELTAAMESEWSAAVATAEDTINHADSLWKRTLEQAEANRKEAHELYVTQAANTARATALQWLDTKEGKSYVKKQQAIATDELKVEILRGTITKPKDMKKAATQRACDSYIRQQQEAARKKAQDESRLARPPYPTDPNQLRVMLEQKT